MSGPGEIAVLADIHGNYPALEACLELARRRGIQRYLFLGDYVTDFPYPRQVLDRLYEIEQSCDCRFIRGNREEYMIDYRANGGKQADGTPWTNCSAQGALLYCYENLTDRDIDWFEGLPISGSWHIEGMPPIAYCHGSMTTTRSAYARNPSVLEQLASVPEKFLVTGHVHKFRDIWFRGSRILSAGSIGVPVEHRSRLSGPRESGCAKIAQMVILHLVRGTWKPEFLYVPYDWQKAVRDLEISGLAERAPVWAAMLRHGVYTGEDPFVVAPSRAQELYRQETGVEADWPQVPEEFWRRAAKEFGVRLWD